MHVSKILHNYKNNNNKISGRTSLKKIQYEMIVKQFQDHKREWKKKTLFSTPNTCTVSYVREWRNSQLAESS